jgi:DNA-binding transcriptional LysR family regulator
MTSDVTLRQLRYFAAAAETGQFSMAAASVFVSQSAITNAVLLLEDRLGVKLFDRKPHGVALTAEGHSFYQHARHILDSLQDALREPRFRINDLHGAIRIAATYSVLGYFLPPLFARFRANYPDIDFDLHDRGRREVEAAVLCGEMELGVVILSNVVDRERFGHHVLMRSRRQLWAASRSPRARAALSLARRYCAPALHPAHHRRRRGIESPLLDRQRSQPPMSLSAPTAWKPCAAWSRTVSA